MQIWLCEVEWFQNSEMRTLPKPGKPYGILIIFPAKRDVSITRYAKSFDSVKKVMRFENILTLVKNRILFGLKSTHSVANANAYFDENMLLSENPQFSSNHYETLTQ